MSEAKQLSGKTGIHSNNVGKTDGGQLSGKTATVGKTDGGGVGDLESRELDLRVECGLCGNQFGAPLAQLQFALCGCPNRARICLENRKHVSHLLGGGDDQKTFVHIYVDGEPAMPRLTLRRWNQLQQRFKTTGSLQNPPATSSE